MLFRQTKHITGNLFSFYQNELNHSYGKVKIPGVLNPLLGEGRKRNGREKGRFYFDVLCSFWRTLTVYRMFYFDVSCSRWRTFTMYKIFYFDVSCSRWRTLTMWLETESCWSRFWILNSKTLSTRQEFFTVVILHFSVQILCSFSWNAIEFVLLVLHMRVCSLYCWHKGPSSKIWIGCSLLRLP